MDFDFVISLTDILRSGTMSVTPEEYKDSSVFGYRIPTHATLAHVKHGVFIGITVMTCINGKIVPC